VAKPPYVAIGDSPSKPFFQRLFFHYPPKKQPLKNESFQLIRLLQWVFHPRTQRVYAPINTNYGLHLSWLLMALSPHSSPCGLRRARCVCDRLIFACVWFFSARVFRPSASTKVEVRKNSHTCFPRGIPSTC
jgi:hypothetical protein